MIKNYSGRSVLVVAGVTSFVSMLYLFMVGRSFEYNNLLFFVGFFGLVFICIGILGIWRTRDDGNVPNYGIALVLLAEIALVSVLIFLCIGLADLSSRRLMEPVLTRTVVPIFASIGQLLIISLILTCIVAGLNHINPFRVKTALSDRITVVLGITIWIVVITMSFGLGLVLLPNDAQLFLEFLFIVYGSGILVAAVFRLIVFSQ